MTKRITTMLSTLVICLIVVPQCLAGEPSLRTTLEESWKRHMLASQSGKASELQKTLSSYRFSTMKNGLARVKRAFTPKMVKSIAQHGPDIFAAEYVTLLERGDTAGLVFIDKSEAEAEESEDDSPPQTTFLFIKFVKETSGWKVDGHPQYQFKKPGAAFTEADLSSTYKIDGIVRAAPELITPPYATALLDVFSYGYKTELTINEVTQGAPIEGSRSGSIKGGLRKGKNTITITLTPTGKGASMQPRVKIRRILENRETVEVFKYEPEKDIAGEHSLTFTVE